MAKIAKKGKEKIVYISSDSELMSDSKGIK